MNKNITRIGEECEMHEFESSATGLADKVETLFCQQLEVWDLAKKNYQSLKQVEVRIIPFGEMIYEVQFNPSRLVSSQAKVDPKSIGERRCFLCEGHLPKEQKGLYAGINQHELKHDYQLLVNPFPIFRKHLTIPAREHTKQSIDERIGDMLELARQLPAYTLFYNGPECGASAPDHMHFQAGCRNVMPFEFAWESMNKRLVKHTEDCTLWGINEKLNHVFLFKGSDKDWLIREFDEMKKQALNLSVFADKKEPMMNILCYYADAEWYLFVFLRRCHRPAQYFAEGTDHLMISPGAVDLGGIVIAPLKKDFWQITKTDLESILHQVLISESDFNELVKNLGGQENE